MRFVRPGMGADSPSVCNQNESDVFLTSDFFVLNTLSICVKIET
ncbi:MAG: hypothetical protein UU35_C0006G0032 [Candidatus Uhrbacteria bacterium GW2011_GWC2_41_11]|uniref:Uncharacterized protein n=1 Tax=Candidatus Uhrbacteria bacterium GW2011_GWC2_41_11 TaxID=1618985 RepID=A0A0G0UDR6_9BACT|nr:MAG: hypothetical protein UU35_C0006G0032 [Candidatus Uhrbacteria bacterium GW2011_GWC2_41_11]